MTTESQQLVQRAEAARDLKDQMQEALGAEENKEFQFYEWSPGRTYVSLWDLQTGEQIELPRYQAAAALSTRDEAGNYRFTASEDKAPERLLNSTKCMFHKDSAHRAFLVQAGVVGVAEVVCRSEHLAGEAAMRAHAESKHANRFRRAKEALDRAEMLESRDRQDRMAEAMLTVAKNSAPTRKTRDGD